MNGYPTIVQGGMGAAISNWHLARSVSQLGQVGVFLEPPWIRSSPGACRRAILGSHMRRGLDHFPFPDIAERIWKTYYIPGGKPNGAAYKTLLMHSKESPRELQELCIAANFVEVFLAREGHDNPVGINYPEKVQLPHLPSIYGAMLAGVAPVQ